MEDYEPVQYLPIGCVAVDMKITWPFQLYFDLYKWGLFVNVGPFELHVYCYWDDGKDGILSGE